MKTSHIIGLAAAGVSALAGVGYLLVHKRLEKIYAEINPEYEGRMDIIGMKRTQLRKDLGDGKILPEEYNEAVKELRIELDNLTDDYNSVVKQMFWGRK